MGTGYKRADRVGDLILEEISRMIVKEEVKDPRVQSVVPTDIEVSDDLSFARIFFTIMDEEVEKEEALAGLTSASGFIKKELSKKLRLRRFPELDFKFDTVLEKGYRIDELLREIKEEDG